MTHRIAWLVPVLALALGCGRPLGAQAPAVKAAAGSHHVVIVTIDGLRPDAVTDAGMPALSRLLRDGAASRAGRVPPPWLTLPSHFTMVTGQNPARHGILKNKELEQEPAQATLFNAVHDAGGRTGLYIGKFKLVALAPRGSADVIVGPRAGDSYWEGGASAALAARFAQDFARERFTLALVHLREPDDVGHDAGWMTPPYHAALAEADRGLAGVLRAIQDSGLPTTVILTSDHGGEGMDHWHHEALDSKVPWACMGPGVKPGTALKDVALADVGATAAALLGVKLPDVEGRVVPECLP
ncbi:MAG: alkaline phosphatase family protein [Gammaproteobacteria bacterium]